ncbi:MAG TPA: MFS transporter [Thermomicrobiales bacterium]|nr:MFS transporter [Thermomicrobiales bacterium]
MAALRAPGMNIQSSPGAARIATSALFFANGAGAANWVVRIPAVQDRLNLSTGALGAALLCIALGSLVAMPLTGLLVARAGSKAVSRAAALVFFLALPLPALAPDFPLFVIALLIFGATTGSLDVSMNSQGVTVELQYGRPIMSSYHALFSLGGLVGAAAGGVIAGWGVAPGPHLVGAAVVLGVCALGISHWMLGAHADVVKHGPMFARPTQALAALGVVAFCVLMGEGAVSDWSAIYLKRIVGTGPGLAAAGFAVFSLTMAFGRLGGDYLVNRVGPMVPVRVGGVVSATGVILAVLVPWPVSVLAGFALIGLGFSFVFPVVVSAAARTPGMPASVAIAAISTTGYFGFLVGPPLIGLTAEIVGLRAALLIVAMLAVLIAIFGRAVEHAPA